MSVKKSAIFLPLLLLGCSEKSGYKVKHNSIIIHPKNVGIKKVTPIPWRVGPLKKQKVSKGVSVSVKFPLLSKDDLTDMTNRINVDSWIVRIRRERVATREQLQYLTIPFVRTFERGIGKKILKQLPIGTVNILYSAAAISTRFENFLCPAFGHKKTVKDVSVVHMKTPKKIIYASPADETHLDIQYEDFSYRPFSVNGGSTLVGSYIFDIALFNTQTHKRMSAWYKMSTQVKVGMEGSRHLKGCAGYKIPKRPSQGGGHFKNFRF